MRAFAPFALVTAVTVLGACGSPGEPSDTPAADQQLTLPIRYASSHEFTIYHRIQPDLPIDETRLSYGLADGYPQEVTITTKGIALSPECRARLGGVVWSRLVDVKGTAARLSLSAGTIEVELIEEGEVTAILEGDLTGQECTPPDKPVVSSVKLYHRVVLQVDRVAGFVVDQLSQQYGDCKDQLVLPSGVPLRTPVAHPLNAAGRRFDPENAPSAAAIVLRSTGSLSAAANSWELVADPGTVSVSVETPLPVQGLRSFQVVGPASLSSAPATLYLERALSKGSMRERIQEGMSYKLHFPEQRNSVTVEVSPAMTTFGKLCANLPGVWFAASSSTPEQCTPRTPSAGDAETFPLNPFPIATIGSLGECRLEVTIPGSSWRWTTRFSTTR